MLDVILQSDVTFHGANKPNVKLFIQFCIDLRFTVATFSCQKNIVTRLSTRRN
jgi:hypothetical protein